MPLVPGQQLGPYAIVAALGAGGMGEVYRARDSRLGRDVAIKVLPTAFAADADRPHRFEKGSHDGRFLLYAVSDVSLRDLWVLPADGRKPVPFMRTEFVEDQAVFSPDGRWVAYISNQTGAYEVYVRAFTSDFSGGSAATGSSSRISRGGGTSPRWRGDGRELFYLAQDGKMMAVAVSSQPEFQVGTPAELFQAPPGAVVGEVTTDGKRLLLVTPVGASASAPFTVVVNWTTELKK